VFGAVVVDAVVAGVGVVVAGVGVVVAGVDVVAMDFIATEALAD
jgi:hypothetical protein